MEDNNSKSPTPQFWSPIKQANILLDQWARTLQLNSLPPKIQDQVNNSKINIDFNIAIAYSATDPTDLKNALHKGKRTAPGKNSITYTAL